VKDVKRIRITKVYASCPGMAFWGVIGTLQSDKNICYPPPVFFSSLINEDLPGLAAAVFTFDNLFFRHQACCSLLPARLGYKLCQAKHLGMLVSRNSICLCLMECSFDPPECHPGQHAYTFLIRFLMMSLTSVSIFFVCCYSRYSIYLDGSNIEKFCAVLLSS
jgi:hypothetical protein